jgi:hypothetical protein
VLAKREQEVDKLWNSSKAKLEHIRPDEWKAIIAGAKAAEEKEAA